MHAHSQNCPLPATPDQIDPPPAACLRQPEYLYQLGRWLNQNQRYNDAIDRLEAALMLQPEHLATQIEYAIALEGSGDRPSATALLQQLAENPALDETTRGEITRIQQQNERLSLNSLPGRSHRNSLNLSFGHDDNLLGSSRYDNFELTLAGSRIGVRADSEYTAHSGRFTRTEWAQEGEIHTTIPGRWQYALGASYRWSLDYAPANRAHLGMLIERSPRGPSGFFAQGIVQQLYLDSKAALRQSQFVGGSETITPWQTNCRSRLGYEIQQLAYLEFPLYNGIYQGANLHLACTPQGLQVQLRLGIDSPENEQRPGGRQTQLNLRVSKITPFLTGQLFAEYEHYRQRDQHGYTPLLENNARRHIERHNYRAEYRWVLHNWHPYIGMEWLDQTSNLPLFSPRNLIINIGIRQAW